MDKTAVCSLPSFSIFLSIFLDFFQPKNSERLAMQPKTTLRNKKLIKKHAEDPLIQLIIAI